MPPSTISRATQMPLGTVVGIMAGLLGGYGFLETRFTQSEEKSNLRYEALDSKIDQVIDQQRELTYEQRRMQESVGDRWTYTDEILHWQEMQKAFQNAGMAVEIPRPAKHKR